MTITKSKRGGVRVGAGRKKGVDTKLIRVACDSDEVLSRLAKHHDLTKREMLDMLVIQAEELLFDSFQSDVELDKYFEVEA